MNAPRGLVDRFGRAHTDLRVSVTDRCNLRCNYCMPRAGVPFRQHEEILRFEEIARAVGVAGELGIRQIRLTGGEPLVRKGIVELVGMLSRPAEIDEVAMTTNGILLAEHARSLKQAGLDRLNISLDTLDPGRFARYSGRDALAEVLRGIDVARQTGFRGTKINALAIRGRTEADAVPLAEFARAHDIELRFIEFMPLCADAAWAPDRVLPVAEIHRILQDALGPLLPVDADAGEQRDGTSPATLYRFADGGPPIGLIPSVSRPFCPTCNRLRLTADGRIRNCLFASEEHDLRGLLRSGATDEALREVFLEAVAAKPREHGTADGTFAPTARTMHQIGG